MNIKQILKQQQKELNDALLFETLAKREKDPQNKKIFELIAKEELEHYKFLKRITGKSLKANKFLVKLYILITTIFGLSFGLKLINRVSKKEQKIYTELSKEYPQAKKLYTQETEHEAKLLNMIHDKKLLYAGAIVLGMNDALVELTGTLSGTALAFDKSLIVGITGLIMGVAASLSLASSSYLETKESSESKLSPLTAAFYTGMAYISTTSLLVLPYFIIPSINLALSAMFMSAFIAIVIYNFYIAIAKGQSFYKRTAQMLAVTFSVAFISYLIGYVVHHYFGINV